MNRVLPDAEALISEHLHADPQLIALVASRIYTDLPKGLSEQFGEPEVGEVDLVYPLLLFERVGGPQRIQGHLDVPRIQVDAWGNTKAEARLVAATAQASLYDLPGTHARGVVTAVEETLGLRSAPDPDTDRPRYQFEVLVYVHPHPEL